MNAPYNILLVEDNPGDERLFSETLIDTSLRVKTLDKAGRLADALELISKQHYDVILLDLGLPDSTGLETVKRVLPSAGNAAVVVLSGLSDLDLALEAVKLGAQDYVTKVDLGPEVLERVVRYARERVLLGEHTRMLSRVVEETLTGIFLIDHRGKIQYANRSAATFPVKRAGVPNPGENDWGSTLATAFLIDSVDAMVHKTMSSGERVTRRLAVGTSNDTQQYLECTTYPHRQDTAGNHWTVVQLIDVTEEVRATNGLIRAHRLEFLGKMSGEVAHEFNNQMAVIAGHLDAMQIRDANPSLDRHIDACRASISHLRKKVAELQAISSRQVTQPTRQNLTSVITSHVARLKLTLRDGDRIDWTPGEAIPITFDRDQLDFVLSTILDSPLERQSSENVHVLLSLKQDTARVKGPCLSVLIRSRNAAAVPATPQNDSPVVDTAQSASFEVGDINWDTAAVEGIMRQIGGTFDISSTEPTETHVTLRFPQASTYAIQGTVSDQLE